MGVQRVATSVMIAFIMTATTPANGFFASPSTVTRTNFVRPSSTERQFSSEAFIDDGLVVRTPTAARPKSFAAASSSVELPPWLNIPQHHLAAVNLRELQKVMRAGFFTETEALKLAYAIEEAAHGDDNMIAGAAEFCRILVETMEMGLNALVGAAFHFCACVEARHEKSNTIEIQPGLQSFGEHSVAIATDASRLKKLEMVASKVMSASASFGFRVSPDAKDAENLRKLLLSETRDWRALAIRSAACLYRLRGLQKAKKDEFAPLSTEGLRVAREALYIYAPLASRMGMHRLKNELEGAAFRLLYVRQYHKVSSTNDVKTNEAMNRVLNEVKEDMTRMLEEDDEFTDLVESFSVTARVKEPYSMWKKMLRSKLTNILQVPDALALRIVLEAKKLSDDEPVEVTRARERALCYYAQKLCLKRWLPADEPRFKDYIDSPKANGYQSLHYTAHTISEGEDWTLEIQVRSEEMHQVAEFGLASHWEYKAQKKPAKSDDVSQDRTVWIEKDGVHIDRSSDAYLRKVQEWHWQQHATARQMDSSDTSPASDEPVVFSDIWQSKVRADRIRARTQRLEPYIQALTAAQLDLTREFVFIFITQSSQGEESDGKVLALPSGACVLDALREGERSLGIPLPGLRDGDLILNGAATSVTRQLNNGDVLNLPSTPTATTMLWG